MFAPTIDAALTSGWADDRRGRRLSWDEARQTRIDYGPESHAGGVYDAGLNALVFPTGYRAKDLKGVVLHELGHALTLDRAQVRSSLITGLPSRLQRHVFSDFYTGANANETLRLRVLEALAEGYAYMVDGRLDELPAALSSELTFMLQTVDEGETIRFEFERTPDGDRTSSRLSEREIVDSSDPEEGHSFADMRLDPDATPWDLTSDELAARRRRESAA